MKEKVKIYCCQCGEKVKTERVEGDAMYPGRLDLKNKVFFRCMTCGNYVGTHKSGRPLGVIPTPEIRKLRINIHNLIDPLWRSGRIGRKELYKRISDIAGYEDHTALIRSAEEAKIVIAAVREVKKGL